MRNNSSVLNPIFFNCFVVKLVFSFSKIMTIIAHIFESSQNLTTSWFNSNSMKFWIMIVKLDFEIPRQNFVNQRQWFSNLYLSLILICDAVFNEIIIKKNEMTLIFNILKFEFLKKTFLVKIEVMFENESKMCVINVYHFKIIFFFLYLIKFVICHASTCVKLFSKIWIDFSKFCKTWLFKYFVKIWISSMLKSSTVMIELMNESMNLMHNTLYIILCL